MLCFYLTVWLNIERIPEFVCGINIKMLTSPEAYKKTTHCNTREWKDFALFNQWYFHFKHKIQHFLVVFNNNILFDVILYWFGFSIYYKEVFVNIELIFWRLVFCTSVCWSSTTLEFVVVLYILYSTIL